MTLANIIVFLYALLVIGMLLWLAWGLHIDERYYREEEDKLDREFYREMARIEREIEECERQIEAYTNANRRLKTAARNKGWKIK